MKTKHSYQRLTLSDSPGLFWLLASLFLGVGGIAVACPLGLCVNADDLSQLEKLGSFSMGCIAVATGLYVMYQSPLTICVFDCQQRQVTVRQYGLLRWSARQLSFDEILSVELAVRQDNEDSPIFQPYLLLRSGARQQLSALWMHDELGGRAAVIKIQQVLSK